MSLLLLPPAPPGWWGGATEELPPPPIVTPPMRELPPELFMEDPPMTPCDGTEVLFSVERELCCCPVDHRFGDSCKDPEPDGKLMPRRDAKAELLFPPPDPLEEICDPMTPPPTGPAFNPFSDADGLL